jgi:membrane peptidoglycan carboxypeptidase
VADLTLEESVILAGLITAPSRLNPIHDPEAAQERAAVVLDAMVESRRLDRLRAEVAKERPANLNPTSVEAPAATWFADWVREQAAEIARSFEPGHVTAVRVRTTFDPRLQSLAERIMSRALADYGKTEGALVAMRPDGVVLAMVGGRSYDESQYNRAVQAMRQPGSTFKLFVYFAALRNGFSPDDVIEDAPVEIGRWRPENFGERYHGRVSLADAFARSLNAATVRLAQSVGIDEVVEAARLLGIDAQLRETPSLALGTSEVSLLDLTGAFASVRAGTAPVEPWGIAGFGMLDQQRLLAPGPPATPRQSLAPYDRPLIEMLKRVIDQGTGRAAALDGFAAGKTGTSENYRDAWFIGFTEELVAGVWVGNDDGRPMDEITGGKLPAAIWKEFMAEASRLLGREAPAADPGGEVVVSDALEMQQPEGEADGNQLVIRPREPQLYERGLAATDADEPIFGAPDGQVQPDQDGQVQADQETLEQMSRNDPTLGFLESDEAEMEAEPQCDVDACSRRYRSFRASDCTYQPYRGRRKLCPIGSVEGTTDNAMNVETPALAPEQGSITRGLVTSESDEAAQDTRFQCNYDACSEAYDSFQASDCTYQPYSGGSRKLCLLGSDETTIFETLDGDAAAESLEDAADADAAMTEGTEEAMQDMGAQCNYEACSTAYDSFRASDCTYQPYGGGSRKLCQR